MAKYGEIVCFAEPKSQAGSMWKDNDGIQLRIFESNHPRFTVGRCLDFGHMEIAITEGYKIIINPK
ncbi:MAG: hypothetical protein WC979_02720 [Candidatus Pacearchaeota archaeon]|jgi:hypothetical protein|nr:hypothetical protein [Clostridia bacterium]